MDLPPFEELLSQIKTNMRLAGIPFDSKIKIRFYVLYIAILLTVIEEVVFFYSNYAPENFLMLTQLAPCLSWGTLSLLKFLPVVIKRQKVFDLTRRLNELYSSIVASPKKKSVVKREVIFVKVLIKYFFILNAILIAVYNFSTLVFMLYSYLKTNKVVKGFPFAITVPFSTEPWLNWLVVYLHSICSGFACILFISTVDALCCILTSQICNNFSVISNEIKDLDETNVALLKDLVEYHKYVFKLSEDLEEIFKLPNLFNMLVGSFQICVLGFQLTIGGWSDVPGCVLFLLSVILQILMMSVFGENLIRESSKVCDAAFASKWYNMDKQAKKKILMIMTRSQKTAKLTAYDFSIISYGSFTRIMSTSWSYFTILRTVYSHE